MAKTFLEINPTEHENLEVRVSKKTASTLEKYAQFRGCLVGDVVDAFAETLTKRDREFKAHINPPKAKKVVPTN